MLADTPALNRFAGALLLLGLTGVSGLVIADDAEAPGLEFLEYLGSWDESDEDWVILVADAAETNKKQNKNTTPRQTGRRCRSWTMKIRVLKVLVAALIVGISPVAMSQEPHGSWDNLTESEREVLAPFADQWESLTAERQQRLAAGARRFAEVNAEQRAAARGRFETWRDLSDTQRAQIRDRYRQFQSLSAREKARIRGNYERFRTLPPDRRQMLRERFRNMTPDQRQKIRDRLRDRQQRVRPRPMNRPN